MFHMAPFWTGAALGAGVVWLLNNRRVREQLSRGKEFASHKLAQDKPAAKPGQADATQAGSGSSHAAQASSDAVSMSTEPSNDS